MDPLPVTDKSADRGPDSSRPAWPAAAFPESAARWIPPAILAATALAYAATLALGFVFDDHILILTNDAIRSWSYLPTYFSAHIWSYRYPHLLANYYRPLFLLWLRLNYVMFGLRPWGWHLTSVLAHLAVTWLVYRLATRLTGNVWVAGVAGLIFGLHPVHAEAVADVTSIQEPLSTFFILAAFLAFLRSREPAAGARWRAASVALAAAALLSKESGMILPLLIGGFVCMDFEHGGRVEARYFANLPTEPGTFDPVPHSDSPNTGRGVAVHPDSAGPSGTQIESNSPRGVGAGLDSNSHPSAEGARLDFPRPPREAQDDSNFVGFRGGEQFDVKSLGPAGGTRFGSGSPRPLGGEGLGVRGTPRFDSGSPRPLGGEGLGVRGTPPATGSARGFVRALQASLPYWAVVAAYLPLRIWALKGFAHPITPLPLFAEILSIPSVLAFYLRLLVWPAGLSCYYDTPYVYWVGWHNLWLPLLALAAVTGAFLAWYVRTRRSDPPEAQTIAFAAFWMAVTLFPVLNFRLLPRGEIAHDRYVYLPSVGLVLLIGVALGQAKRGLAARGGWPAWAPRAAMAGALLFVAAAGFDCARQSLFWSDDLTLNYRAHQIAPHNVYATTSLAAAVAGRGMDGPAMALYRQVLEIQPNFWTANVDLAYLYYNHGDFPQAARYFSRACAADPTDGEQFLYLGMADLRMGQLEEAEKAVRMALLTRPNGKNYHLGLAMVLRAEGKFAEAAHELAVELARDPGNAQARALLGEITRPTQGQSAESAQGRSGKPVQIPSGQSAQGLGSGNGKDN